MHVLIVESKRELGDVWRKHLMRQGCEVSLVQTGDQAIAVLRDRDVSVIVLDVFLSEGSALAVADFASYRQPKTRVVLVTDTTFFSDGSIFNHVPNACAFLRSGTPVDDLTAVIEHHGQRAEAS